VAQEQPQQSEEEARRHVDLYDWKKARMRSESNIALGVILLIGVILAGPLARSAEALMGNTLLLIILGLVGAAIHVGVARWRKEEAYTVFGLNMLGTVLLVVAALGLLAPEQTAEMLTAIPDQRLPLTILALILIAMGVGLRYMYHKREVEQREQEAAEAAAETAETETTGPPGAPGTP
jgi:hypothetical protein